MSVNKTVHKGNCNKNKRKCYWTEDYEIESMYNNNIQTCFSEPFFTKGNKPTFITYSLGQKKNSLRDGVLLHWILKGNKPKNFVSSYSNSRLTCYWILLNWSTHYTKWNLFSQLSKNCEYFSSTIDNSDLSGYPLPRLAWFSVDEEVNRLVDPTYESDGNATLNTLFIKTLKRSHFGQTFACVASNNNATQPVATNVTIDMRCEFDHFFFYSIFPFGRS